jgi:hypothetical protein
VSEDLFEMVKLVLNLALLVLWWINHRPRG